VAVVKKTALKALPGITILLTIVFGYALHATKRIIITSPKGSSKPEKSNMHI
jgi:hypothetical protein